MFIIFMKKKTHRFFNSQYAHSWNVKCQAIWLTWALFSLLFHIFFFSIFHSILDFCYMTIAVNCQQNIDFQHTYRRINWPPKNCFISFLLGSIHCSPLYAMASDRVFFFLSSKYRHFQYGISMTQLHFNEMTAYRLMLNEWKFNLFINMKI